MVFSQYSGSEKNPFGRQNQNQTQFLLSKNPAESLVSDHVELDFSDIFGPVLAQALLEAVHDDFDLAVSIEESNEIVCADPVVIHNRSHSLVGPSSYVSQSLKLSKLTMHEPEVAEEEVEAVTITKAGTVEEPVNKVDRDSKALETVGLQDFEVLKVVGQGAFAKVYQMKKKGTSEIN